MKPETVEQLINLNKEFYHRFARPFSETRRSPQPGFFQLIDHIPDSCSDILDVGCGEGRFIRFLQEHIEDGRFTGVDFSQSMLERARSEIGAAFYKIDLSKPACLDQFDSFNLICCLATLQHIPGRENRLRLLTEMRRHLKPNGRIFLSNWQFLDSQRQQKKIEDWSEIGFEIADLEDNDYLITWSKEGYGRRYVAYIPSSELYSLAVDAELQILHEYRSDGKEGNLNLYSVLALTQ